MSDLPIQNQAPAVSTPERSHKWELLAAATFVVIHLTSPLWIGELYPFTISPMFCGSPCECCRYEVFTADGTPLDTEQFNLHMVYDGNPPGLGMGIVAEPTLHAFGQTASQQEVANHVREVLNRSVDATPKQVVVHQHHFFSADHQIKHGENVFTVNAAESGE